MGDEEIEALKRVADLQRRGLLTDLEAEEARSEILGQDPATDAQVPNAGKRVGLFESAAESELFGSVVIRVAHENRQGMVMHK